MGKIIAELGASMAWYLQRKYSNFRISFMVIFTEYCRLSNQRQSKLWTDWAGFSLHDIYDGWGCIILMVLDADGRNGC